MSPIRINLSEKDYRELEAKAEAGAAAAKELHASKRDGAVERLLQERKISPAQREHAARLYDRDLGMFQEWAGTLAPIAALPEYEKNDGAGAEFNALVEKMVQQSGGTVDFRTAYMTVQRQHPALARRVLRDFRGR